MDSQMMNIVSYGLVTKQHERCSAPTGALLLLLLTTLVVATGCRTAASLGLPVSTGSNYLLSEAATIRGSIGHVEGIPTELAKAALSPHRMEAGDVLVIEPNDFNSSIRLQSDQTVQQDGTIELGSYGRMYVGGKSVGEIQGEIENKIAKVELAKHKQSSIKLASHQGDGNSFLGSLSKTTSSNANMDEDLSVSVRLVNHESGKFYVMGEVNAPGSYALNGSETVLDAIITAGGLSNKANEHKIILTRPRFSGEQRVILPVCYQQILQLGDVATNYQLQPGDRIYVPSVSMLDDIRNSLQFKNKGSCPHCSDYSKDVSF